MNGNVLSRICSSIPQEFAGPAPAISTFLSKTPPGSLPRLLDKSTLRMLAISAWSSAVRLIAGRPVKPQTIDASPTDDVPGTGLASWGFPIVAPNLLANGGHRVYYIYNKNVGVDDAREDTTGQVRCRFSDDDGLTWSAAAYDFPIAPSAISHPDPNVPPNWIVYQTSSSRRKTMSWRPLLAGKPYMIGGQLSLNLLEHCPEISSSALENILSERDPNKCVDHLAKALCTAFR